MLPRGAPEVPGSGGRRRWTSVLRLGRPCCAVEPRTNSGTSPAARLGEGQWMARPATATAPSTGVQHSGASNSSAAAEAHDVLHPLPSLKHRHSVFCGSLLGNVRQSKASTGMAAGAASGKRAAFPSRTLGSLTAWQMLAADVQQDMDKAAASGHISRESELFDHQADPGTSRGCSSQVEPSLVMSEGSEVPLQQHSADTSDVLGEVGSGILDDLFMPAAGDPSIGRFQAEFKVLGELGRGAFGSALKTQRRADGTLVCIKVLDTQSMGATERRMTRDEVRVLSSLQHPNIVRYADCFHERGQQYIVMEYAEEGDLEKLLRARCGTLLSEEEVMLKFVQLCLALQHVHGKGIIHHDVKSSNIFCSRHGILKLGDFGISKALAPGKSYAKTMVGTPYYFSPEVVEDKPYNKKSDVWSAGCVLYELATQQRPFKGGSISAIAVKILRGSYTPLPEQYSTELHQLVALLLRRKPEQRPSIDELLGMPYMRAAMRRYRDHVQRAVENRKASYFHSLDMYQLDTGTTDMAAALLLHHRQSQGQGQPGGTAVAAGPGGVARYPRSSVVCAAAAAQYRLCTASGKQPHAEQQEQLAPIDTVVVKATAPAASADLASALVAARAEPAAAADAASSAAISTNQPAARPPRQSTFSAARHLQAIRVAHGAMKSSDSRTSLHEEQQAAGNLQMPQRQPQHCRPPPQPEPRLQLNQQQQEGPTLEKRLSQGSRPASPRSMLVPGIGGFSSLETTSSGGSRGDAAIEDLHPCSTPTHPAVLAADAGRAANSVGDLAQCVPALLNQVQRLLEQQQQQQPPLGVQLMQQHSPAGGGGLNQDAEDDNMQQRRLSRRAAVQECMEEFQVQT